MPITAVLPTHLNPSLSEAAVGTGVGSLSGWGAALVVIALLGLFAWWTTRPSRRHRRR